MTINISNPRETQQILKRHGFTFKKSLGQNFLIEPNILEKIVDKAEIDKTTAVIEIGPGIGALTQKIAERAGKVLAIEIDQRLLPILSETLEEYDNVKVINSDVLKISLQEIIDKEFKGFSTVKVVANLPYYVTTPIIMKLLEERLKLDSITVMVQKEVGERMTANPGGKDFGSLTLAIQFFADASILFNVPSTVFVPKPNVDSTIIQLKIRKNPPVEVSNEERLFKIIRSSFVQRRKTLFNNLVHNIVGKEKKEDLESILLSIGIDPKRRAETLTLGEFAKMADALHNLVND